MAGGTQRSIGKKDRTASGTIDANGETVEISTKDGISDVGVQITGTWVGQIEFEITIDGTNWTPSRVVSEAAEDSVNATAVNGVFTMPVAGMFKARVRASAWTSGSAEITMRGSVGQHTVNIAAPIPTGDNVIGGVTLADGADATQGAKADSAATTDTGTFSLIALFKRLLQRFTTLLADTANIVLNTGAKEIVHTTGTVSSSGNNIILTPGAGNKIRIFKFEIVPDPDSAAHTEYKLLTSATEHAGWWLNKNGAGHFASPVNFNYYFEGETNESVIVNLSQATTCRYNLWYAEVT